MALVFFNNKAYASQATCCCIPKCSFCPTLATQALFPCGFNNVMQNATSTCVKSSRTVRNVTDRVSVVSMRCMHSATHCYVRHGKKTCFESETSFSIKYKRISGCCQFLPSLTAIPQFISHYIILMSALLQVLTQTAIDV